MIGLRAADPDAGVKTHTLFMGLDLSLEHGKTFHRVKDVSGDSFIVTVDGSPVFLSVNRASRNLRVNSVLKLTNQSASISSLESKRAYTPHADPRMNRMVEMNRAIASMGDAQSLAMDRANALTLFSSGSNARPSSNGSKEDDQRFAAAEASARELTVAFDQAQAASILASSYVTSPDFLEGRSQDDLAKELYDGIEVTFELSSATPLNNPYVLLVARFRESTAPVSTARNWIYAKSLDPISDQPTKFHVMKGGFPPGYILEEFRVHLYNRGEEVATNVSSKRVALTRDEAFEYLKIQYVASHKKATLPATPAMGRLPTDLHQRLSGGQFNRLYYVTVSLDGLPTGAFLDESCTQRIEDDYLQSVMNSIRFKPALQNGKPVEAVARVKLGELPL